MGIVIKSFHHFSLLKNNVKYNVGPVIILNCSSNIISCLCFNVIIAMYNLSIKYLYHNYCILCIHLILSRMYIIIK